LNYTQNVPLANRLHLQIAADLFNVFDKQTAITRSRRCTPRPSACRAITSTRGASRLPRG
jgi:hypothetical protein